MYKISLTDANGRQFPDKRKNGPDEDYLYDYEDSHIADLASMLGVNAMIGTSVFTLGNSNVAVKIECTGKKESEGRREFEQYVKDLIGFIQDALPSMDENYYDFFHHFVEDFEKNGLKMPMWK